MKIKNKRRKHLTELLTTFQHQNKYHLIFRWAEGGNLMDLWTNHMKKPKIEHGLMCWFAQQCHGLAHGLDGIHNLKISQDELKDILQPTMPSSYFLPEPSWVRADIGYKDHGVHGNIKPPNVLWFSQDANEFGHGILKISGLGFQVISFDRTDGRPLKGHGGRTWTYGKRKSFLCTISCLFCFWDLAEYVACGSIKNNSPMPGAPEHDISDDVSRPFDIWSLGCLYLEFITWLLLGAEGLEEFMQIRMGESGSRARFQTDSFYKVLGDRDNRRAEVKESVGKVSHSFISHAGLPTDHVSQLQWIDELKQTSACSQFLEDLLEYILARMVVVDAAKRDRSPIVVKRLEQLYQACRTDKMYALALGVSPFQRPTKETETGSPKEPEKSLLARIWKRLG